ncbi:MULTISPECIES: hypothetical protein [Acinetobacter]|nr:MULTISPECIES: hypothetical protein [Acinetobacter]ENV55431.1 hypothetical protein F952_00053 [Acinetobacter baylyi DSM 14961 = CIP 107474]KAF2370484.1 hypothetical protein BSL88_10270 [Acinetobacter baylyi]KAF2373883.1 hypothetical protein BSL67_09510 [Acinetobacter baylyi]KAF2377756.1 hypothetical protein BSN81_06715 [Acinetobacter baylyi]KAF2382313.1 hypothetical protein BSN83_04120 [Acinetobacter baylyi]
MKKIYSFFALFTLSSMAFANTYDFMPEAKLENKDVAKWNVGLGITQKLGHLNVEWINPYGIAYVKGGAYVNGDHAIGGQAGFRYPYYLTGTQENGYYIGFYAGSLDSHRVNDDYKSRFGGGLDLAFVWLNKERVSTVSVGIGAGEALKDASGVTVVESKPQLQFSYTLSFGL